FSQYGFRPESWVPCYGLAESSVALAFPPINRRPVIDTIRREPFEQQGRAEPARPGEANVIRFVAAGRPMPLHEVRIVDTENNDLGERAQGRLLFRGPSKTESYYKNPPATAAVLAADGWMDSGDLAYWAGGELYITGRVKDCIIKSGRNIVPQEVEAAASEVNGVRRGCVAAFGIADADFGTERLVVVAETRTTRQEELRRIEADIIHSVDAVLGIPPDVVQLVGPQSIPKTSSGKIRRFETRSMFGSGAFKARKRPPWLQMVRLGLESAGSWMRMGLRRVGAWLRRTYVGFWLLLASAAVGVVA